MQGKNSRRRRRYAAPIGGVYLLLVIIGVIAVVVSSVNLTFRALDNTSTRQELEHFLLPLVMFDPAPFEHPSDISNANLLLYSTWSALTSDRRMSYTYETFEFGIQLRIPASDLNVAADRLFGPEVVLEHQTFDDFTTTYYFDEATQTYNIPVTTELFDIYTPSVESIERVSGDIYHVRVGYIPPAGAWSIDFSGTLGQPDPEKHMIFVVRRLRGGGYNILALRDYDGNVSFPIVSG